MSPRVLDEPDEFRLIVRRIVRLDFLVSQFDPFSGPLLVVNDHVLDVLSRVDSEVLIASSLQRRHVLRVLHVPIEWLRDAIPFNEFFNRHRPSVEPIDGVLRDSLVWRPEIESHRADRDSPAGCPR